MKKQLAGKPFMCYRAEDIEQDGQNLKRLGNTIYALNEKGSWRKVGKVKRKTAAERKNTRRA